MTTTTFSPTIKVRCPHRVAGLRRYGEKSIQKTFYIEMIYQTSRVFGFCIALPLFLGWVTEVQALDHLRTGRTYDPQVSAEKRYPDTKGGFEIWLVNSKKESEKLLYRTHRSAELLFPNSMDWVVVNDAEGSGTTSCKLFRRKGGKGSVDYELSIDLTKSAWRFFEAQTGRETKGLHHDYVRARCWLEDPEALVISLIGHGDPGHFIVRYWTCVYLVKKEEFSVELKVVNQKRVVETGPK